VAPDFSLLGRPDIFVAGQMTGVEGYVESMASGLVTAWHLIARVRGASWSPLPRTTILGALLEGYLFDKTSSRFSPMNANFGLLPGLKTRIRNRQERKQALGLRSAREMADWVGCARSIVSGP
jgi:methylenetetrahydrofolate--tRNA-(uracil-5-)-methyltransferase